MDPAIEITVNDEGYDEENGILESNLSWLWSNDDAAYASGQTPRANVSNRGVPDNREYLF